MRAEKLLLLAVSGCSFHITTSATSDGSGGPGSGDAAIADAPIGDARVFLDGPAVGGSLVVTPSAVPDGTLDLTGEGTSDWAHWGLSGGTSFDHRNMGSLISNATVLGSVLQFAVMNVSVGATWRDGTPDPSATTATGIGVQSPGGLTFTVPAGVASRTLRVYVGAKNSGERFDASLSDGSAPSYTNTQTAGTSAVHLEYDVVYNAATDGQTLTITWTDIGDNTGGFAMLLSATLQ